MPSLRTLYLRMTDLDVHSIVDPVPRTAVNRTSSGWIGYTTMMYIFGLPWGLANLFVSWLIFAGCIAGLEKVDRVFTRLLIIAFITFVVIPVGVAITILPFFGGWIVTPIVQSVSLVQVLYIGVWLMCFSSGRGITAATNILRTRSWMRRRTMVPRTSRTSLTFTLTATTIHNSPTRSQTRTTMTSGSSDCDSGMLINPPYPSTSILPYRAWVITSRTTLCPVIALSPLRLLSTMEAQLPCRAPLGRFIKRAKISSSTSLRRSHSIIQQTLARLSLRLLS